MQCNILVVGYRFTQNRVSTIRVGGGSSRIVEPSPSTTSVKLNLGDTSTETDGREQEESGYHSRGVLPTISGRGGLLGIHPHASSASSLLPPLPPLPSSRFRSPSNLPSTILSLEDYKYFGGGGVSGGVSGVPSIRTTPDWEIRSRMMTEEEKETRTLELLHELRAWKAAQSSMDRTTESEGSAFSRLHSSLSQPSFSFSGSSSFLHTPRWVLFWSCSCVPIPVIWYIWYLCHGSQLVLIIPSSQDADLCENIDG